MRKTLLIYHVFYSFHVAKLKFTPGRREAPNFARTWAFLIIYTNCSMYARKFMSLTLFYKLWPLLMEKSFVCHRKSAYYYK